MPSITPGTSEDLGQILERGTEHYDIISLKHGLHEKTNMGKDRLKLKKKKKITILYIQPQNIVLYLDSHLTLLKFHVRQ